MLIYDKKNELVFKDNDILDVEEADESNQIIRDLHSLAIFLSNFWSSMKILKEKDD